MLRLQRLFWAIYTSTEFQLTFETYSFDLSTFLSTSVKPNSTYNLPKSRNWDKWVLWLQQLFWAIYTRCLSLVTSNCLSRLAASTWVPCEAPRSSQTVLTISQSRETGTSGSHPFSDYSELHVLDICLYWDPADSRHLQLGPAYLPKHLGRTKQYLESAEVAKLGQVGTVASATILSYIYQIPAFTEIQQTLNTYSLDLHTLRRTSVKPNSTYNMPKSRNWYRWVTSF